VPGLRYISWNNTSGYAVTAKAYVRALVRAGIDVTWTPMLSRPGLDEIRSPQGIACPILASAHFRPVAYDTVLIHTVPEYYPPLIADERRAGRRILGYAVWELETLPQRWPAILNQLDGILVPCRWNAEVFRRSGVEVPIHVVPHLSQFADTPPVADTDRAALSARLGTMAPRPGQYVFYNIGFWSNRKAPYLALEAYFRAFTAADPVLMIVKTSVNDITEIRRHWRNGFRPEFPSPHESLGRIMADHRDPPPVAAIADESLEDGEIQALHERADCFVSLTRTEGWGMAAFEAARLGKPVVMTGYGGQLDFLPGDHCWLVDYTMVPVHEPTWSAGYKPGDRWAAPSVTEAATHLRAIFADQATASQRASGLARHVASQFSPEAVTASLIQALSA
jgi:glycosyltransferase involved in cell wall biosynthesis